MKTYRNLSKVVFEKYQELKYCFFVNLKQAFPRFFIKEIIIRREAAIGDILMTLPLLRGLKNKYPWAKISVATYYPEIFSTNPYVERADRTVEKKSQNLLVLPKYEDRYPLKEHIADIYCRRFNVEIDPERSIDLYISSEEEYAVRRKFILDGRNYVILQPWPGGGWTRNKDWYYDNWVEVVKFIQRHRYEVLQIGTNNERLIPGTIDLRGKTNIREVAVILKYAKLLLACSSFSQQLAHSYRIPTVILYGSTSPKDSCHSEQHYIFKNVGCNPCWGKKVCPHRRCMDSIKVDDVVNKLQEVLKLSK